MGGEELLKEAPLNCQVTVTCWPLCLGHSRIRGYLWEPREARVDLMTKDQRRCV